MSKASALSWREVFSDLLNVPKVIYVPELAEGDFDEDFRRGLVCGLFVKRDQRLVGRVFETLSSRLDSQDFRDQVVALYRRSLEREVSNGHEKMAQSGVRDPLRVEVIRDYETRISNSSWENFESHCERFYTAYWDSHSTDIAHDSFFRDN